MKIVSQVMGIAGSEGGGMELKVVKIDKPEDVVSRKDLLRFLGYKL